MIVYILFVLMIVALTFIFVQAARGKNYTFTYTLPPANTKKGKQARYLVSSISILLLVLAIAFVNLAEGNRSARSIASGTVILLATVSVIFYVSRGRASKK